MSFLTQGYLALVLHGHLPYVRHPDREDYLEERWLFEAITECYLPFIHTFEDLVQDGVDFHITFSLSPPLVSMLTDPLLQERYAKHLDTLVELAEKEANRTENDPEFNPLALMYLRQFKRNQHTFHQVYQRDLTRAFKRFESLGKLELTTCGGTHGYFPLMRLYPEAVEAQVAVAVETHTRVFGRAPRGIWLPECGYYPGIEWILKKHGIEFFFTDSHGVLFACPRPRYGLFAPLKTPSGVHAFGRDLESSKQVWSMDEGYPGDPDYREYYRDIGYDTQDWEYIKPYVHPSGIRINTGMKYFRITGKTDWKQPYKPAWSVAKTEVHAGNFLFNREHQVKHLAGFMDRKPIIVSPYDAELFGHWWFEGPTWINWLMRKISLSSTLKTITPSMYLQEYPINQPSSPTESSWGANGYHEVWLEGSNDWIYRHLHKAAERMSHLADRFPHPDAWQWRVLNQAARELLLAQSSDWAFIMKTGTMVEYAHRRTKEHLYVFDRLYRHLLYGDFLDDPYLRQLEDRDNIFPNLDYRIYSRDRLAKKLAAGF